MTRHDELPTLVDHLDRYPLQGPKAAPYAIWREMVLLKQAFRRPDRDQLETLARRLSAVVAGRAPPEPE